jgi:hypothetical protein
MPRNYSVTCYYAPNGRHAWSQTQEAASPAWAIAQACLPPDKRKAWANAKHRLGDFLLETHPGEGQSMFTVVAEVVG